MKYVLSFILGLALLSPNLSQANTYSEDCEANLSVYYEYYKNKNYADAYKPWSWVYRNCPDSRKSIYIHGPRIVEYQIKKAEDPAVKEAYIDTLLAIYDQRLQYFPEKEGYVLGQKGTDMFLYRRDSLDQAFKLLAKSYELEQNKTSASVLTYYFQAAIKMYEAERLTKPEMIEIYDNAAAVVGYNLENQSEKKKKYYQSASDNIEILFAPVASCDDLIELYAENFEGMKDDADKLNRAARMMNKKKCTDNQTFFKISNTLFELDPSASAAANLGRMSLSKKQYNKAIDYYTKAVEMADNDQDKASYLFGLASAESQLKRYSSAREHALQALAIRPDWGDPYMLIGYMYAENAGKCGSNDFERKAVYWAALEKFRKAKSVDTSVSTKANEAINAYSQLAPDKTLTFQFGYLDKETYRVECWINETVAIPSF